MLSYPFPYAAILLVGNARFPSPSCFLVNGAGTPFTSCCCPKAARFSLCPETGSRQQRIRDVCSWKTGRKGAASQAGTGVRRKRAALPATWQSGGRLLFPLSLCPSFTISLSACTEKSLCRRPNRRGRLCFFPMALCIKSPFQNSRTGKGRC